MRYALALALIPLLACTDELELDGRGCPCAEGWLCCADENVCVRDGATCPAPTCEGGCDDTNPCTADACEGGTCVHTPTAGACDDGDRCTTDTCSAGECVFTPDASACDDGDPCTTDTCGAGECLSTPDASACDDGDPCTTDTCETGGTCGHDPVYGGECGCDLGCDDSNPCTTDTCEGRACVYSPASGSCADDQNPCTADACGPEGECLHTPISGSCDDHDSCTAGDTCVDGTCRGTNDADGDGERAVALCGGFDCNDADPGVHSFAAEGPPGAPSCRNGKDDDCDGKVDAEDLGCTALVGLCTEHGWCYENPLPAAAGLTDVWASGPNDVWISSWVGLLHYDGSRFSSHAIWSSALAGSAPDDVWLVGDYLQHWDGSRWTVKSTSVPQYTRSLWRSSSSDVWIGTDSEMFHWDGVSCSTVAGSPTHVYGLWGSSASDVWGVGAQTVASAGKIVHWDGTGWSTVALTPGDPRRVWGASAADVWAVGPRTLLHWDGASWQERNGSWLLDPGDVSGNSSEAVWVFDHSSIWRWNGWNWAPESVPLDLAQADYRDWTYLKGGTVASADEAWAFGAGGLLLHRDASGWSTASTRFGRPAGDRAFMLRDLWAVSSSAVFAVGSTGPKPLVLERVEGYWQIATLPLLSQDVALSGVWASSATDAWAVGSHGTILRRDGPGWAEVSSGTSEDLSDVWGSGPDDVWAVGAAGTILHWDGIDWSPVDSGTTESLGGIWGKDGTELWVVGPTFVLVWNGTWTRHDSPLGGTFLRTWGTAANDVWAVGPEGVQRWNGMSWSVSHPGPAYAIWGVSGTAVDVVSYSSALHWDGVRWTTMSAGNYAGMELNALGGLPTGETWAAGHNGLIVHRAAPGP